MKSNPKDQAKNRASSKIKEDLDSVEKVAGRSGADTIKLWDGYKTQAQFWRAIALIQIPGTFIAIFAALIIYFTRDVLVQVPDRPQPGFYSVKQLPDSEFISAAERFVNAVATYQPETAELQFKDVRKYLWEPAITQFDKNVMKMELKAILETRKSQIFISNTKLIQVNRDMGDDFIVVKIPGTVHKLIGDQQKNPEQHVFTLKMITIPRNVHNDYGIVIVDFQASMADANQLFFQGTGTNIVESTPQVVDSLGNR